MAMDAGASRTRTVVKLVLFVLVCIVGAGWLVVQLGNIKLGRSHYVYEVVLPDAGGLLENDDVKIAGVRVGKVLGMEIERGRAHVTFAVQQDEELGQDTELAVRWRNLLGLRYLYLYPAGGDAVPPGHTFPAEQVRPSTDLSVFLNRLTPVMNSLDPEVSNVVVQALAESLAGREQRVRTLVRDAGAFLEEVASRDAETRRLIDNGARLLDAYAEREGELRELITSFANVSTAVADRNDELIAAIERIADMQAETHRLVTDNEDNLRGVIAELDAISSVLAVNHDEVEDILAYTSRGIVQYHRISRWGQWFNIRVPGLSIGEDTVETERGATLPPRGDRGDTTARSDSAPSRDTSVVSLFRHGLVSGAPATGGES